MGGVVGCWDCAKVLLYGMSLAIVLLRCKSKHDSSLRGCLGQREMGPTIRTMGQWKASGEAVFKYQKSF